MIKNKEVLPEKTFLLLKKKGNSDTEILKAIEAELKEKTYLTIKLKNCLYLYLEILITQGKRKRIFLTVLNYLMWKN